MSPATTVAPAPTDDRRDKDAPVPVAVPFTRAAKEHTESFLDQTVQLGAGSVALSPVDVPAYGFIRGIWINLTGSGGVGGGATVAARADAPFSILDELVLHDVNGAPLVGPINGYDLFAINKYGGYGLLDPRRVFTAVATGAGASGNFDVWAYVPVEVNGRDGLGSIANTNSASTFKLRMTVAPSGNVYSTAPATTLPQVRIRAWLDGWTQPNPADLRGNPQNTEPPAHGTTSYWSKTTFNVAAAGFNSFKLPRVGNLIRELIFIWRDGAGARSDAGFPGPASLYWDTRLLHEHDKTLWRTLQMGRRFNLFGTADTAGGPEAGLWAEDFMHEFNGEAGFELRDGWLGTVQSTRLELSGTYSVPGTLTVLTNDVSPAGEVFV